jgi:hypothetical protein
MLTLTEAETAAYLNPSPENLAVYAKLLEEQEGPDVSAYLDEARAGFPSEDCLQEVINLARGMARGRVTKQNMLNLAERLEEIQNELWRSAEYGAEQLDQAARAE